MSLVGCTVDELLSLAPDSVAVLTSEEILYLAQSLGAFWRYDYQAAREGRVGFHALMKSGTHTDVFFSSAEVLQYENLLQLIGRHMAVRLYRLIQTQDVSIVGVPRGATRLGETVARYLGASLGFLDKRDDGTMVLRTVDTSRPIVLVEDVFSAGTGYQQAAATVIRAAGEARILPIDPVILNRGGRETFGDGVRVDSLAQYLAAVWEPAVCPLCKMGSIAIKPKSSQHNWRTITTAQLP